MTKVLFFRIPYLKIIIIYSNEMHLILIQTKRKRSKTSNQVDLLSCNLPRLGWNKQQKIKQFDEAYSHFLHRCGTQTTCSD